MQQPRLKDIDRSMVTAGKKLESAAPEDIHLKILESIAVNSDILKWIKGTAKGMVMFAIEHDVCQFGKKNGGLIRECFDDVDAT